jgi:predicted metal-dependent hydrolase
MQGAVNYAGQLLPYTARFTKRSTLAISVLPDCSIEVIAPNGTGQVAIEQRLKKRGRWILRQKRYFEQFMPRTPERLYVAGETHLYLGRQYRIQLIDGLEEGVKLRGSFLSVTVKDRRKKARVKELVLGWYREKAEARLRERFESMLAKFEQLKSRSICLRLQVMKLRWGSHSRKGIITLNPELIRAPSVCVDYVIAHELAHVVHPHHGAKFYELLGAVMNDWPARKEKLERVLA